MASSKKAVGLVVSIVVLSLLAAFLFPIVIGAIGGPETATTQLDVGNSTEVQPNMTVTLDATDTAASPSTATYTVTASGQTATATVANGSSTTLTVDGADVTISPTAVTTGSATAEVDYPTTYGWGPGASAMWGILPIMIVLALFLFVVYLALRQT